MKKIAIGQAGGPTAVINTSLVGFVESSIKNNLLYGVLNGYEGLVKENLIELKDKTLDLVKKHKYIPGACLGSGRYQLTDEKIEIAVNNLKKNDINALVFIGGNGTMAALQKIKNVADRIGYELQVIGIPKTVDNDLGKTDHAPGFASAAKFIAFSTRDISKDLEAMKNFEQVRIIETMGRNAGWLAASSGLLKESEEEGPHIIYLPERKFHTDEFLVDIKNLVKEYGTATIVVSEGIKLDNENNIQKAVVNGRVVLGGVSKRLEDIVKENLGFSARGENLGMNQRSFSLATSSQDRIEAYDVGEKASELIDNNETNLMVTIQNSDIKGYDYHLESCLLEKVTSLGEKALPYEFINNPEKYYEWLRPLIGGDLSPYPSAPGGKINYAKQYCRFK
ncbi:MAG TPA: diphosphate--fructose-6-phosphate 1-phosphotransferase [Clostridium sp.]|uniref:diphosphate--fructose-6-phosphate 1-phosphotransferase n=1 Tax=Clostridium sp. TaxID=1506 RepID=UPI002F950888